jgi:hypothetical protein
MFTASGATKSFSAELKVSEERLLRYAEPKVVHPLVPRIAERRIEASPKVRADCEPRPSDSAAGIALVLIEPAATASLNAV